MKDKINLTKEQKEAAIKVIDMAVGEISKYPEAEQKIAGVMILVETLDKIMFPEEPFQDVRLNYDNQN